MEVETREGRAGFIKPFGQRVGSEWFLSPTTLRTVTLKQRACFCLLQMDQMRSELLQERAVRQDLECDKTSLERQVRTFHT